jgi:hypothetical protein
MSVDKKERYYEVMPDREVLEAVALESVCALMYYELADYLDSTSDAELLAIIEQHQNKCDCDQRD